MDESLIYEVIEINAMGDHTVVGRYTSKLKAQILKDYMQRMCEEPRTSYYVNDIREEY